MLQTIDRSFIGEGIIHARLYGSQEPFLPLGNCDTFNISFATDRKTLPNYMGGGGNSNVRERVTDVTSSIGMFDLTAENVALVTRSTIQVAPTAAITDEAHTSQGVALELIPFKYLPDLTKPVTVKTAGDVEVAPGTDYLLVPHGIQVLSGGKIDATGIKVSYTPRPSRAVHMLNGSQKELELFIAGLNDAQSGAVRAAPSPRQVRPPAGAGGVGPGIRQAHRPSGTARRFARDRDRYFQVLPDGSGCLTRLAGCHYRGRFPLLPNTLGRESMRIYRLAALCVAVALAGCGEPKLDGSSDEAMKASIQKITEQLSPEKRTKFQEALTLVVFQGLDFKAVMKGDVTAEDIAGNAMASLSGKTADELITQAEAIKAAREAREKEQALAEIRELEAKRSSAEQAKGELAKFTVTRSRFFLRDQEYSFGKEPVIQLSVHNGTEKPVSRAYFKGTIASPGRSVPWLVEDFNYQIRGGLEPGESADWSLAPNMFSEWGKVDAPEDALFTVDVVRIDGADNKVLYDSQGLSEHEIARLKMLKEKYSIP